MELEIAVNKFVQNIQTNMDEYMSKKFPNAHATCRIIIGVEYKDKWVKLVRIEGSVRQGVYGFIARQNFETKGLGKVVAGDIHKPASFASPAKHARGSVFDESTWGCAGPFGIEYLKGPTCKF